MMFYTAVSGKCEISRGILDGFWMDFILITILWVDGKLVWRYKEFCYEMKCIAHWTVGR